MPFQRLLESLVRAVPGAQAALLLDSQGELVVRAGALDDRHQLVGAYQGIALFGLRKASERSGTGPLRYLVWRYRSGHVILRPLKDGYYLVLTLGLGAEVGRGVNRALSTSEQVNAEL